MGFEYFGTNWLTDGFTFPSLSDYIKDTKERLRQPLTIPAYATAGEAERIKRFSQLTQDNPYLQRAGFAEVVRQGGEDWSDLRAIPYGEYPELYNVCVFASKILTGVSPIIFLYTAKTLGMLYNACALDYQDKVWIYLSDQLFQEHGMLKAEELCYLVGHELGHAQCHHTTIRSTANYGSDKEYSADRAGMIVCAKWMLTHISGCQPEYAARQAALYAAATLLKLETAMANGPNKTDWRTAMDYEKLRQDMDGVFDGAARLSISTGSHPHTRHRVMAMINFSQSQLFYRCLGLDPADYSGLCSDEHLQRMMAYQLTDQ